MNISELKLETLDVELMTIRVGGCKLTLSVFSQIPNAKPREFVPMAWCSCSRRERLPSDWKELPSCDNAECRYFRKPKRLSYEFDEVVSNDNIIGITNIEGRPRALLFMKDNRLHKWEWAVDGADYTRIKTQIDEWFDKGHFPQIYVAV